MFSLNLFKSTHISSVGILRSLERQLRDFLKTCFSIDVGKHHALEAWPLLKITESCPGQCGPLAWV